jgi:alkylated DNA repair dioxygenase AlkB
MAKRKQKNYPGFDQVPCVEYRDAFLPPELHKGAMERLLKEVEFCTDEESSIVMAGKRIPVPRKQVGYGDVDTAYRFTGVDVEAKSWEEKDTPTLYAIKEHVIKTLGYPVSYVLLNLYRNGSDYIGYHSDDERDLDPKYPIISLTLGAARPFRFRHKVSGQVYEGILKDNSLVLMKPPCQRLYKHSLPKKDGKMNGVKKPRLNLTFRIMR